MTMHRASQFSLLTMMLTMLLTRQRLTAAAFSSRSRLTVMKRFLSESSEDRSGERKSSGTVDSAEDDESIFGVYRNKNNIRDQVFSAMSGDGGIKVTAVTARNLVNDMMIRHTMTAVPADALGRTVICGLLLSNGMQDEQVLQITMNSDGPIRGIVTVVSGRGEVRGYVGSPMLGEMELTDAVGRGMVQIVKNHPSWPRPYNGITQIRHGDIDRDVGIYLAESEQRSCALAAATAVTGILCKAAGGYMIEQLPNVEPETVERVQENLNKLVNMDGGDKIPTNLLLSGVTPLEIAEIVLDGLDMQPLQQLDPVLKCDCTENRLFRAIRMLPKEDVDNILEKQEKVEARCEFCGQVYEMSAEEVRERLATATGDPHRDDEVDLS